MGQGESSLSLSQTGAGAGHTVSQAEKYVNIDISCLLSPVTLADRSQEPVTTRDERLLTISYRPPNLQ